MDTEITSEIDRLRRAIKMLDKDFEDISVSFKNSKTVTFDNLLDSQRLIVNDPLLVVETEKRIADSLVNAECALVRQLEYIVEQFSKISNPYFQERKIDVEQIVGQLLKKLSLIDQTKTQKLPTPLNRIKGVGFACLIKYLLTKFLNLYKKGVKGFAIGSGSYFSFSNTFQKSRNSSYPRSARV